MGPERIVVPYQGTPEQEAKFAEVLAELKDTRSPLIPVMEEAQTIFGYLPEKILQQISDVLGITLAKIYGVATFYSFFSLYPKGKYQISVCLGTACYVKGSGDLYEKLESMLGIDGGMCTPDGKFSLDNCRCVGACGLAPVLLINDDVYGRVTNDQLVGILSKYN